MKLSETVTIVYDLTLTPGEMVKVLRGLVDTVTDGGVMHKQDAAHMFRALMACITEPTPAMISLAQQVDDYYDECNTGPF